MSRRNRAIIKAFWEGYRVTATGQVLNPVGSICNTHKSESGYYQLSYKIDGVQTLITVHRFVAYCKYGMRLFEEGIVARHLDSDRTDNSWDNVAIGTCKDNSSDRPAGERQATGIKIGAKLRTLTSEQVQQIRYWYRKPNPRTGLLFTIKDFTAIYGLAHSAVWRIIRGVSYSDVPGARVRS